MRCIIGEEREIQKNYWMEHSADLTVEAMMLDSKAVDLDKEERPEVLFSFFTVFIHNFYDDSDLRSTIMQSGLFYTYLLFSFAFFIISLCSFSRICLLVIFNEYTGY